MKRPAARRLLLAVLGPAVALALGISGCTPAVTPRGFDAGADLAGAATGDLAAPITGPRFLSETGLYSDFASRTIAPGIITYAPRYELWSDGAMKTRYLKLPPGTRIDTTDLDNWIFPVGTKVWKEFRQNGVLVETRLLHKQQEGRDGWWRSAYVWNLDGSDAAATIERVPNAVGTTHDVPSQYDCRSCHIGVSDTIIGVSAYQLSSAGGNGALTRFATLGLLSNPPAREYSPPGSGLVQDTLGYLHGNCGHCHNPLSTVIHQTDLRMRLRVVDADGIPPLTPTYVTAINQRAYHDLGGTLYLVVPGQPDQSQMYFRMSVRDLLQMPPACTKVVDTVGLATIRAWISGL